MNNDSGSPAAQDAQLRADIRLLGRILGDTVRDQEGVAVFELVERIRQTSIRFHRDDDKPARYELEAILDGLSIDDTLHIVRAFSYFLPSRQHRRRPEQHPPHPGQEYRRRRAVP